MKKYPFILASLLCFSHIAYGQTVQTNVPVTLVGKISLIKSLHPNPQLRENQPAIRLSSPLNVEPAPNDELLWGTVKTKLIQLHISHPQTYHWVMKNNGRKVTIYCDELFGAHTGHHTTKVLCSVHRIVN